MQLPRVIKAVTRPLLRPIAVQIQRGPNRGYRWSLATAGRGYAKGTFESARILVLQELIKAGDIVWDVGAHKGYVTLLASRCVTPGGRVIAIEPACQNLRMLRQHVRWNALTNVEIVEAALGSSDGDQSFGGSPSSLMGRVGTGRERVAVRRGDTLIPEGLPVPTFVKIDVEGYEAEALTGVIDVVPPVARLFVATHSEELLQECRRILETRDFTVIVSGGVEAERSRGRHWRSDPEIFATGPQYEMTDRERALIAALKRDH